MTTSNAIPSTPSMATPNGNGIVSTPNGSSTTNSLDPKTTPNGTKSMKVDHPQPSSVTEPPRKRMKVDDPQVPHYNSHNIYSRPPAPPQHAPIPSLPKIEATVSPLDFEDDDPNGLNLEFGGCTVAPLPEPSEPWPLCAYCHKGGDLSRCSSCRQSYYCNRDCQVAHWDVHCIVCQPGPPQPAALPQGGQPVAPPTTFTTYSYPNHSKANGNGTAYGGGAHNGYSVGSPYGNGYGSVPQTPTHRPRQRKRNSTRSGSGYLSSGGASRGGGSGGDTGNGEQEQYYCEQCDRFFKNGQALGGHRSRVHSAKRWANEEEAKQQGIGLGAGGSPMMRGPGRPKKKTPKTPRRAHVPAANGQYVCPHCSREFASGNALGGHISGAHTKKARRLAEQQAAMEAMQRGGGQIADPGGYRYPVHRPPAAGAAGMY